MVPVEHAEVSRIRTGYERVFPHMTSSKYSYTAEQDGKVISHDESLKLLKIRYRDNQEVTLKYGEEYTYCADKYITQDIRSDLKINDIFKRGDILIYHAGFFKKDHYSNQVDFKHGTFANVALVEIGGTFEDSSVISTEFSNKTKMKPVYERLVVFDKDDVVIQSVIEGQEVSVSDYLIVIEDSDIAAFTLDNQQDEANDYLIGLNRSAPRAKYTGKVVKIDAYYAADVKSMHPSVQKVLKPILDKQKKSFEFARGSSTESEFTIPKPLPKDTKYKQVDFDENTVVIQYLIQEELESGIGDKIVISNSLKTVISDVQEYPGETLSGEKIDILFSSSSISNRIVNSPAVCGLGERCLVKLEEDVLKMYFDE